MYFTAVPLTINGKTHIAGIGIDITDRKLAVAALRELNEQLEQKVEVRTQELFSANQELTAMNEEMTAINQTLEDSNQQLEEEIAIRQQKEGELSVRGTPVPRHHQPADPAGGAGRGAYAGNIAGCVAAD
jgi:nitrate/nitrite-specific signal transduction histidine kinase